jgi:predicted CoA-binding protein
MNDIKTILDQARTIAVMGCSDHPWRTSNSIARYLQEAGYRIVPVNPEYETVLGEPCYPDLQHVPRALHLDLINIFRNPRYTADMVRQVIGRIAETDERPAVWTQIGVSSPEAKALAEGAGLPYIADRCIAVEHRLQRGSREKK